MGWPAEFASVVRANHGRLQGWVVASSNPCLDLQEKEIKAIHRNLKGLRTNELPKELPANFWFMGILLCPGDETTEIASFASGLSQRDRVRFYVMPGTDFVRAFEAWYAFGLGDPLTADIVGWPSFHKQFGADLNNQVYRDSVASP